MYSELGIATHFVPSRNIPLLLDRLSRLEGECRLFPMIHSSVMHSFTLTLTATPALTQMLLLASEHTASKFTRRRSFEFRLLFGN
jgi:hypothetical protein